MDIQPLLRHSHLGLVLAIVYLAFLSAFDLSDAGLLTGRSFSLRTFVDNGNLYSVRVHESYSMEQKRAKISYDLGYDERASLGQVPTKASIYLTDEYNQALLLTEKESNCRSINRSDVFELIFGFKSEIVNQERDVAPDFVVGPAWLIYFLAKHRQELRVMADKTPTVRNIPTRMFSLDYKLRSDSGDESIRFLVQYRLEDSDSDDAVPLRVSMRLTHIWISVDFMQWQSGFESATSGLLGPEISASEASKRNQDESVKLDEFNFARSPSLSRFLDEHKKLRLAGKRDKKSSKFSFMTKFMIGTLTIKSFVSYDGSVDSMRYEIDNSAFGSGVRKQIFNFNLNRLYHLSEKVPKSNNTLDGIIELGIKDKSNALEADNLPDEMTGESRSTFCRIAQIRPLKPTDEGDPIGLSLGELLVGAQDFVYMGRAQVRGIAARVYESFDAQLPIWLDQSMVYDDLAGNQQVRPAGLGLVNPQVFANNILVYVAEHNFDADRPQLLLVEVSTVTKDQFSGELKKRQIEVFEFIWDLVDQSPQADRAIDFFSLKDECSSSSLIRNDGNTLRSSVQVEMLLDSQDQLFDLSSPTGMRNSRVRNFALLASLQRDLQLPASMIYHLESRIVHNNLVDYESEAIVAQAGQLVSVSFKIAPHSKRLVKISYLGTGNRKTSVGQRLKRTKVRSFQSCLLMASHRSASVYFGYDERSQMCCIDLEPIEAAGKPTAFDMFGHNKELEIFRLEHTQIEEESEELSNRNGWLLSTQGRANAVGSQLNLVIGAELARQETALAVRRLKVSSVDGISLDSRRLDYNDRIVGYGLVEQAGLNKRIYAPSASVDLNSAGQESGQTMSQISESQCQAACLADPACRSYSICVQNYETKCVISSLDLKFSGPAMRNSASSAQQLADLALSGAKKGVRRGAIVNLTLDYHLVAQLVVHPNCAIQSKDFLSLFGAPKMTALLSISKERMFLVNGEEQCASLCLERNSQILKQMKTPKAKEDSTALEMIHYKRMSRRFCRGIEFLGRDQVSSGINPVSDTTLAAIDKQVTLSDRMISQYSSEALVGYCILNSGRRDDSRKGDETELRAQFFRRSLKFELLYGRQYGISLRNCQLSDELAKDLAGEFANLNKINEFVSLGNNVQEVLEGDEAKCARICYLHRRRNRIPCKSFDLVVRLDPSRQIYRSYCYLNAITLSQAVAAKRLDLIRTHQSGRNAQVWHYEIHDAFAGVDVFDDTSEQEVIQSFSRTSTGAHKFVSLCIASIGVVSGILLTIIMNKQFIRRPDKFREDTILYKPSGGIEMFFQER